MIGYKTRFAGATDNKGSRVYVTNLQTGQIRIIPAKPKWSNVTREAVVEAHMINNALTREEVEPIYIGEDINAKFYVIKEAN